MALAELGALDSRAGEADEHEPLIVGQLPAITWPSAAQLPAQHHELLDLGAASATSIPSSPSARGERVLERPPASGFARGSARTPVEDARDKPLLDRRQVRVRPPRTVHPSAHAPRARAWPGRSSPRDPPGAACSGMSEAAARAWRCATSAISWQPGRRAPFSGSFQVDTHEMSTPFAPPAAPVPIRPPPGRPRTRRRTREAGTDTGASYRR